MSEISSEVVETVKGWNTLSGKQKHTMHKSSLLIISLWLNSTNSITEYNDQGIFHHSNCDIVNIFLAECQGVPERATYP